MPLTLPGDSLLSDAGLALQALQRELFAEGGRPKHDTPLDFRQQRSQMHATAIFPEITSSESEPHIMTAMEGFTAIAAVRPNDAILVSAT